MMQTAFLSSSFSISYEVKDDKKEVLVAELHIGDNSYDLVSEQDIDELIGTLTDMKKRMRTLTDMHRAMLLERNRREAVLIQRSEDDEYVDHVIDGSAVLEDRKERS